MIDVLCARLGREMQQNDRPLRQRADAENEHRSDEPCKILANHQNVAPHGSEKVIVQTAVKHLASKEVHEDKHASKEDGQTHVEELKNPCEYHSIFGYVANALLGVDAIHHAVLQLGVDLQRAIAVSEPLAPNAVARGGRGSARGIRQYIHHLFAGHAVSDRQQLLSCRTLAHGVLHSFAPILRAD